MFTPFVYDLPLAYRFSRNPGIMPEGVIRSEPPYGTSDYAVNGYDYRSSGVYVGVKNFRLSANFGDYCGLGLPNVCKTRARKC